MLLMTIAKEEMERADLQREFLSGQNDYFASFSSS
jgi:hypothetical protein